MMRRQTLRLHVLTTVLALSLLLLGCGPGDGSSRANLVAFEHLVANARQFAGEYVCTRGVHVDGFEMSGLGASTHEKDGHRWLAEPVIWLEGADMRSREDCTRTDTQPSFEFCQAVVCGVFETRGGYGHGGAYAYQLRGSELSVLGSLTPTASGSILIAEGLESEIDGWRKGAAVPEDPSTPGSPTRS